MSADEHAVHPELVEALKRKCKFLEGRIEELEARFQTLEGER